MKYTTNYLTHLNEAVRRVPHIESLRSKNIIITGASGLIGSTVADLLFALNYFQDYKLHLFLAGRKQARITNRFAHWKSKGMDFTFLHYSAGQNEELPAVCADIIIHCAANSHPAAFVDEPVETITDAVYGLNRILQFAVKTQAAVLYISSSEVYGKKEGIQPYTETEYSYVDILNPRACYPSSKRVCETLCSAYINEYGADVKIVRPGHVYGPGITEQDSRAHAQFARNVLNDHDIVLKSSGNQLRSYCYAVDCASAMLTVLTSGHRGEAYNISNSHSIATIRQLALMHAELAGKKVIFSIPSAAESAGYNLMSCSALDSTKLEQLGWQGMYDLQSGVAETLECLSCSAPE